MSEENTANSSNLATRVPFFRPKKTVNASLRKREIDNEIEKKEKEGNDEDKDNESSNNDDSDSSSNDDLSESAQKPHKVRIKLAEKRKKLRGRNLIQTTSKKRRKELDELAEESSTNEEEDEPEPSKFDPDVKFASSGAGRIGPNDQGATARTEVDTEYGRDAQSQFERVQTILKKEREEHEKKLAIEEEERKKYGEKAKKLREAQEAGTSQQPKVYRGMALYGAKEKEDTIKGNASSGLNRLGPIRATQYMRASVRWDYAPDICKDYKETGYCTFGDSCKFMHDRTDYKHGWEIERDWQEGKMKEAKEDEYLINSEEGEGDSDEDGGGKLPHSCHICREHFKQPVVTKCKHYFCESCALKHYQKSKKCAVCGEKTDGVFNVAREILNKMKLRDEKAKKEEEATESDEELATEKMEIQTLPMAAEEELIEDGDEGEESLKDSNEDF